MLSVAGVLLSCEPTLLTCPSLAVSTPAVRSSSKVDSVERRLSIRHVLTPRQIKQKVKMGTGVFLVILFSLTNASILKIDEDFKYQRISVEVSDKVPRHLCQNTLDRLEVRTQQQFSSCQVCSHFQKVPKLHYSKSQIFVQKFNFDKTPTFSRVFHQIFFDNFSREINVVNS